MTPAWHSPRAGGVARTGQAPDPAIPDNAVMRIANSANFRHVGTGLPLRNLYRSDHLGALDAADAAQVRALGVRRVLDFRGVQEREAFPAKLPDATVHSLPIEPTIVQKLNDLVAAGHRLTGADIAAHMQDTYRGFVRQGTPRFAEFFAHLLASDEPTVFHCTAGKDRTGFAAALLLKAVGASDDEVMRDYLLTNERLRLPAGGLLGLPPEAAQVLWRVDPAFLRAALAEVDAAYGSLEGYFREGLGLGDAERARLKAAYLR